MLMEYNINKLLKGIDDCFSNGIFYSSTFSKFHSSAYHIHYGWAVVFAKELMS